VDVNKTLRPAAFGDDDGSVDPAVESALSAFDRAHGGPADVLAALAGSRVLVPVVSVLDEAADGGTSVPGGAAAGEKSSHMAAVSTIGRDGRRGLLAFTCLENLRRWNPDARPVPVSTRAAAESALADSADALVIDLAGPVLFSVDAEGLRALASGYRPVAVWSHA
jgi:hypothetical protein